MKAVILAGGKGTRLRPYTTSFPKPLMPIDEKPILEIIIEQLKAKGFDEFILNIGHLAELMKAFFGDGSKLGVSIKYSREDNPLGTAGGLGLVKKELGDTFLVMNGDILTSLDYSEMVRFHRKNKAIATVGLNRRSVHIDFGVIEVDRKKNIKEYTEKPKIDYLVSMGVYIFEPDVLEYIKPNEHLNMPDLIKKLMADGKTVKGFIHEGYWLDIGRPEDYQKAQDEFGSNRERFLQ
jgi:NDP-sugar pyrophosphorylase family protein